MASDVCFSQYTVLVFCVLMVAVGMFTVHISQRMYLQSIQSLKHQTQIQTPVAEKPVPVQPSVPSAQPTFPFPVPMSSTTMTPSSPISVPIPLPPRPIQEVTIVPPGGLNTGPEIPYISTSNTSWNNLGYVSQTVGTDSSTYRLFGRRKYPRSERYEYFIIDKNGIKIPFTLRNEKEIYDGDQVTIPGYNNPFTATIYKTQELVYNPFPIAL